MPERVLVVEDDPGMLEACVEILRRAGHEVMRAASGEAAYGLLRRTPTDVVVVDLRMPDGDGLDVLRAAKERDPDTVVVLITAFPTVETAVEAMKIGALDYLVKPFSPDQLLGAVRLGLEKRSSRDTYGLLKGQLERSRALGGMVGKSNAVVRLFDEVRTAAAVDSSVLILGESGAGKELVARAIHDGSARRTRSLLAINCAAIPEALVEAELFGYERGAFTGAQTARAGLLEQADGGTVFLDELCELSLHMQAKLLRAFDERAVRRLGGRNPIPFDVRFLAATNRDVRAEVAGQRFREDLFFRIDVIEIQVPPLRERRDDIPLLAAHFLEGCAARNKKDISGFTTAALELLTRHDWPGNARELKNAVERAVAYASGAFIAPEDLPPAVVRAAESSAGLGLREWKKTLERLEREFVEAALDEHGGNVTHAAQALGIHRSTLQRLMRRLKLPAA
jgi:two-component system response regulator HydG